MWHQIWTSWWIHLHLEDFYFKNSYPRRAAKVGEYTLQHCRQKHSSKFRTHDLRKRSYGYQGSISTDRNELLKISIPIFNMTITTLENCKRRIPLSIILDFLNVLKIQNHPQAFVPQAFVPAKYYPTCHLMVV